MVITYYEKENEKQKHTLIQKRQDREEKPNEQMQNTLNCDEISDMESFSLNVMHQLHSMTYKFFQS